REELAGAAGLPPSPGAAGLPPSPGAAVLPPSPAAARQRTGSVLEDILGEPLDDPAEERGTGGAGAAEDEFRSLVRNLVAPHLIPNADAREAGRLARADAALSAAMRAVLHHPRFQSLEALWRAVWMLVRRVETDEQLQIHLLDVSREELVADLRAAPERAEDSAVCRLIMESCDATSGSAPWALIAGDYRFDSSDPDVELLARLAEVARRAGVSFIADASAPLSGLPDFAVLPDAHDWPSETSPRWDALRRTAAARWAGLVAPRLLLREPYGAATDACERFRFEELDGAPAHAELLWGSGAFACAMLLAESFAEAGWSLRPGMRRDIGGLPLVLIGAGTERDAVPCAELLLTERAAQHMMDRGIMPLASLRNQDVVHLVRFHSIAEPVAALGGRWTGSPAT
ncbi:MAG: type VI secretion system contractile sheath domain-containing protein, partial [Gemmatimonadaceae bacterium]